MVSAFGDLASIGGGLIMNIVKAIGVIAFSIGLYFLTKWIQKGTKKQKSFTMTTEILDMNGVISIDKLGFVKSEKTGLLEMQFQKRKSDSIPPIPKHLVKNNHVLLLNYAPGHYAPIDTYQTIKNIESGNGELALINLGMKKYLMSKQREIINRAQDKKKWWEEKMPWIILGVGIVAVVILAGFLFFTGVKLDAANTQARVAECIAVGW